MALLGRCSGSYRLFGMEAGSRSGASILVGGLLNDDMEFKTLNLINKEANYKNDKT